MSRFLSEDAEVPKGAFGEVITGELTPQVQLTFGNTTPPQLHILTAAGGSSTAAVDTTNKVLKLQTGAATNQQAIFESVQPAAYHPGQGALVRFTGIFSAGVAGSSQFIGVGDSSDGFFIGYQGADFGVLRRVGGAPEVQTLSITTGSDADGGTFTITLGDDGTKVVTIGNSQTLSEVALAISGTDFTDVGTGWKVVHSDIDKGGSPENSATLYFISIASAVKTGSFTLTDTGSSSVVGTFAQNLAGVAPTEAFVAQSDFNHDVLDGTSLVKDVIDFAKGNVYQIRYQWLGFGKIKFYVENPETGEFSLFHGIKFSNTATAPSIFRPTLPIRAEATNTTNNTNIIVNTASVGAFTEGTKETPAVTYHGAQNNVSITSDNVETPVLAIKNDIILNGQLNRHRLKFNTASVSIRATTGGQTAIIIFRARASVALTSNHAAGATTTNFISSDTSKGWNFLFSSARVDTTSVGVDITTLAKAGVLQFATSLGGEGSSQVFQLSETFKDAFLAPGAYFVITAERITGGNLSVDVAVNWQDVFA